MTPNFVAVLILVNAMWLSVILLYMLRQKAKEIRMLHEFNQKQREYYASKEQGRKTIQKERKLHRIYLN